MIGKTISHYKIIEEIGRGGMGMVYKAEDTKLKRTVALKFLPPELTHDQESKSRFIHEAQAAASLDHSNICTVHEIDEADGNTFIVMAFIDGQSLKEKIASAPLKIDESINIAIQIAEGLQEAHEKGIIHRDIKSSNIMLTSKGQTKITDFGLVKLSSQTKLTKTGTTVGTVAYMSPEQSRSLEVDRRTDIWSFGVLLYEMIAGQLPFKGDYDQAIVYSIMNEEPEPVSGLRSGVPLELERIINKAIAKNPNERYQHIDEILVDLRAITKESLFKIKSEDKVSKREDNKWDRDKPRHYAKGKRRQLSLLIVAVTTIVLLTSIFFIIQKQGSKFVKNRIIVTPFENKTGDTSQDMLGQMAAEMITQGMSQIRDIEVVPFISVMDSYQGKKDKSSAFSVAAQNEAGILVTGSYYLQDEDLHFRTSIMDARHEKLIESMPSVKGPFKNQVMVLEKLRDQILGALAIRFNYNIQSGHAYIPSFEAYKEFEIGRELFGSDYKKARSHFYKSVKIDSAFTLPLLWLAFTYHNLDQYAKTDSLLDLINKHREHLSLFDRILLDWSIAENSGQKPKAMRFIRKAEELAPKNFTIKYIIGFTALDLNLPRLTVQTFSELGYEIIIEWTRGYWAFNVLASAMYILGEYNDALAVIQLSRKHFPDKSSNLRYESILQAALGQIEEVDRIIDESFHLSGSVPGRVMRDAARGLRAHGYKDDAHKVLQRALKWYKSRTGEDFRYSIARVLYWDEQWAEAQQVFEILNQEFPDDQNFKGYIGVIAARMGEKEKANRIFKELYNKKEPYLFGSHLYWCARISAILGEHQRAVDLMREAYGQGRGYGMYELLEIDFESLRDYPPYIELMRPKG